MSANFIVGVMVLRWDGQPFEITGRGTAIDERKKPD